MKNFLTYYINYITCNFYLSFKYYKEAEPLLKQIIEVNFSNKTKVQAADDLADIYSMGLLGKVDHDKIIKYTKMAYEITSENPLYLKKLAFAYSDAGHYKEAESLSKQALTMNFNNEDKANTANLLGWIYGKGKLGIVDHDQAIKYFEIAHIFFPENISYLINLAFAYSDAGHYKEVESLLKQALTMNFNNEDKANAAYELGSFYRRGLLGKADHNQAVKYFQVAHIFFPENISYLRKLASAYSDAGHYKEAESLLKQVLEINFNHIYKASDANRLGDIYSEGKLGIVDHDQAIKYYQIAYELTSKKSMFFPYLRNLAFAYSNAGHYKEAESFLKQILETDRSNENKAHAADLLGWIYSEGKLGIVDHDQAIKYFEIAFKLNSKKTLYFAKHYDKTELALKECLEVFDTGSQVKCASDLADLYKEGKIAHLYHEDASYYYNIAHEIDPSNPKHIHHLAMEYYVTGNYEEAEPLLKECIETSVNDDKNECAYSLQYLSEWEAH